VTSQAAREPVAVTSQAADTRPSATEAADAAAALDLLLAAAALGPLRRLLPGGAGVRFATRLARRPQRLARQATSLAGELGRVGLGRSTLAPPPRDRRFADPAWTSNPLLRRLVQAYLAAGQTAEQLLADADLDWRDAERMRFVVDNLVQALAPSNNPVSSPVFWKAVIDSGGGNVVRGARHLAADLAAPPRVPSMVAADAFEVGADLAVTPGAVVLRTPMFELLQYEPQTPRVRRLPLLIVPPTINKYYILDLAPGRSLVEYLVGSGQQVFVISWRNPDARHRDWGADAYGEAIVQAQEATQRICRVDRSLLLGLCSGGILAAMVLAHLAATGRQDRLAGFSLAVAVLDQARAGIASAALDERTAQAAVAASAARGFLDGRSLAEAFAWLRPGDLIWNYWVNNYLQGHQPPPFDILYWNADTTRMPARLHRDFVRLAVDNALTRPGAASMLGSPVDLAKLDVDAYVVAGIADHLCPWQSCYRSTQLLGGRSRFVLSTSGHIASMVNPPGNQKATFRTAPDNPPDAADWLSQAAIEPGSWWPDYVGWLEQRSGGEKARPRRLGAAGFRPMDPAPGTYVLDR
jgi:polyhydroxyalkanoate synthase subunit PhaC